MVVSVVQGLNAQLMNLVVGKGGKRRERNRRKMIRAAAQCISRRVGFAWDVVKIKIVLTEGLNPASLTRSERRLTKEVSNC